MSKVEIENKIDALRNESMDLYNRSQWMSTSQLDAVDTRQNQIQEEISELEKKLEVLE